MTTIQEITVSTTGIERDDYCYCCGEKNAKGLHLKFVYPEKGKSLTTTIIPSYYTGWKNVVHGGYLAMLLDEAMAHACGSLGKQAFTAEITVRYLKPANVGQSIRVEAQIDNLKPRVIDTSGSIFDADDNIIAKAKAKFMVP